MKVALSSQMPRKGARQQENPLDTVAARGHIKVVALSDPYHKGQTGSLDLHPMGSNETPQTPARCCGRKASRETERLPRLSVVTGTCGSPVCRGGIRGDLGEARTSITPRSNEATPEMSVRTLDFYVLPPCAALVPEKAAKSAV